MKTIVILSLLSLIAFSFAMNNSADHYKDLYETSQQQVEVLTEQSDFYKEAYEASQNELKDVVVENRKLRVEGYMSKGRETIYKIRNLFD